MNRNRRAVWLVGLFLLVGLAHPAWAQQSANPQKTGEIRGAVAYCGPGGNAGLTVFIPGRSFQATLGANGQFVFNFVPAGTYSLTIDIPGRTARTLNDIVVKDNDVNDLGTITVCRDSDGDGFTEANDCNDNNPSVNPGAAEACNGVDDNCDGRVDEGCALCTDADHDGFYAQAGCTTQVDCNDNDPTIRPTATEVCDGKDNNCNGVVDEGFDLQSDTSNCGSCGTICSFANAGAACNAGQCELAACSVGYVNCDGSTADGCEINARNDVNNCGWCGQACPVRPNTASAICSNGTCGLGTCTAGWGNCDGADYNGCETDVLSSSMNCGGCGHVCADTQVICGTYTYICGTYQCGLFTCHTYCTAPQYCWVGQSCSQGSCAVSTHYYSVGGHVTWGSGFVVTDYLTLALNGAYSSITLMGNSQNFTFEKWLLNGAVYEVTVTQQPAGATCTITNGTGTIAGANVTGVSVTCVKN